MQSFMPARAVLRAPVARLGLAALLGVAACHDTHLTRPATRGRIVIASGDGQRGVAGQRLAQSIVVVARDDADRPAPGVRVDWVAEDGGTVDPRESVTDGNGRAEAQWTLGAGASPHHARAAADGFLWAEFVASIDEGLPPLDVIQPITLETYEGSGQTVHPDYVQTSPEWTRASRYLFITPYPNGSAIFENPSIFEGTGPLQWLTPNGAANPIVTPSEGYYSDPDALYVPERNELWLYFRQVTEENVIRLTTSQDGVHWSTPRAVAHAPNHQIISPTVVRRAPNDWLMWAVNGNIGCTGASTTVELRRSINGIEWSQPEAVDLSQPGLFPWHIDVAWIASRKEYWALYNAKAQGSCTTGALYLATSADGVHWKTFPSPVLARGATADFQEIVYRSSFIYDEASDVITFWYSGARFDKNNYIWHAAVQRRLRADVFATVNAPARAASMSVTTVLPPLRNFP